MTTHVRALYDFSGEPNTSELSIATDELLVLTRTDVGEGWWEGTNTNGQTGLFPEAYVEIYHVPSVASLPGTAATAATAIVPTSLPPPSKVSPPHVQTPRYDPTADDWEQDAGGPEEWDDDWDDDNDTYSEIGPGSRTGASSSRDVAAGSQQNRNNNFSNAMLPPPPPPGSDPDALSLTSTAPVKKSGIFAKSGDSYILGECYAGICYSLTRYL